MNSRLLTVVLFLGLLTACGTLRAADEATPAARLAVRKALPFLKADMHQWRKQRKCAACHHGPMYLWATSVAAGQGYEVDQADLAEMAEWLVTNDKARIFVNAPGAGDGRISLPTVFLAHALNRLPQEDSHRAIGWQRITENWLSTQQADGSWVGAEGRPPIFNTPEIITRLAVLALDESRSTKKASRLATAREQAQSWLDKTSPDMTHQGIVLRLWSETVNGGRDSKLTRSLVETLRDKQQDDGGWRQAEELSSDAFATGQTLFAFHKAGISADDVAVQRAIRFLASTQRDDGTWPMQSRPSPATGRPATLLNPITYAATAWATLGLASHISEAR